MIGWRRSLESDEKGWMLRNCMRLDGAYLPGPAETHNAVCVMFLEAIIMTVNVDPFALVAVV